MPVARPNDVLSPLASMIVASPQTLSGRALWIFGAKVVGLAFTFLIPLVLVRHLSVADFGVYKQLFLVVNSAVTLLPFGFGMSALYFFVSDPKRRHEVVANILLFYGLVLGTAAVIVSGFPGVLVALFDDPELARFAPKIGVILFLFALGSLLEVLPIAAEQFRLAASFIAGSQISRAVLLIAAAAMGRTVDALLTAAIVHGVLQAIALAWFLRARFPGLSRRFSGDVLRAQLSYAMPLGLAGFLYYVRIDLHQYLVARWFSPAEFAIYAIGCFQLPVLGILLQSIGSVLIPRVAQLQQEQQHRLVVETIAAAMRKLALAYFAVYAYLLVTSRDFIVLLFTEQYAASAPLFLVNLTMIPLSILPLDALVRVYKEHRGFLVGLRVVTLIALTICLWFATAWFGLIGAISSAVFVTVVDRLILILRLRRSLHLRRSDVSLFRPVAKIAVSAAAGAVAAILVNAGAVGLAAGLRLILSGTAFTAVYLGALLLLRVLKEDERRFLLRPMALARVRP